MILEGNPVAARMFTPNLGGRCMIQNLFYLDNHYGVSGATEAVVVLFETNTPKNTFCSRSINDCLNSLLENYRDDLAWRIVRHVGPSSVSTAIWYEWGNMSLFQILVQGADWTHMSGMEGEIANISITMMPDVLAVLQLVIRPKLVLRIKNRQIARMLAAVEMDGDGPHLERAHRILLGTPWGAQMPTLHRYLPNELMCYVANVAFSLPLRYGEARSR